MNMDANQYINSQILILIPFLYFIGMFLKQIKQIKDEYIPVLLLIISIGSCIFLLGNNYNSIIQGVLVAGTTVFTNQLINQTKKIE